MNILHRLLDDPRWDHDCTCVHDWVCRGGGCVGIDIGDLDDGVDVDVV